ncbi:ATP-binding cassette sub-family C member 3-like [Physella acuta]|uniref:ATP-binding cassette sub-family C member 3-like n=1 Tax=Physella acuta TaxID=109671 RepID=UPI0027DD5EC1|nr:ATP-binding cassette sub-family C member 3-like [Physella acuta]
MGFCGNSTFWDTNLTLNASWPRLSQCFQSTVLVYAPAGLLWFSSLIYLPYLLCRETPVCGPNTWLATTKTVLSVLLALTTTAAVVKEVLHPFSWSGQDDDFQAIDTSSTVFSVAKIVEGLSFILTAVLVQVEKRCCIVRSGVLFCYWLMLTVCDVIPIYTYVILKTYLNWL